MVTLMKWHILVNRQVLRKMTTMTMMMILMKKNCLVTDVIQHVSMHTQILTGYAKTVLEEGRWGRWVDYHCTCTVDIGSQAVCSVDDRNSHGRPRPHH